jgi:hypothetical protein
MKVIDQQTRINMAKSFAIAFVVFVLFAVIAMQLTFIRHFDIPLGVAICIVFPSLFSLFPLVVAMNEKSAKEKLQERAQRIEAYRASPESHVLHLSD